MSELKEVDVFTSLYQQEIRLENEAINCDILLTQKLETIYQAWADNLEEQHKAGTYKEPVNTISSYIKSRLRIRGASEGSIDHVSRSLDPKYKRQYTPTEENDYDDLSISLPIERKDANASIFMDLEARSREIRDIPDLYALLESPTEATLVISNLLNKYRGFRKAAKIQSDLLLDYARTYGLKVAPTKTSKERPPEAWRGQYEATDKMDATADSLQILVNQIRDVSKQMKDFKPDEKTQLRLSKLWEAFEAQITPAWTVLDYTIKYWNQCKRFQSDEKHAASQDYWFKVGFDNIDNSGAHGSGIVNAMKTGDVLMELSKDKKSVIIFDGVREFTREDVTDQTAKALLMKARMAVLKEECQKFLNAWAYRVTYIDKKSDPYSFYKEAIRKDIARGEISREQGNKLLSKNPMVFFDSKGRRYKQTDVGNKYEKLQVEHSHYGNVARRRQTKSNQFNKWGNDDRK